MDVRSPCRPSSPVLAALAVPDPQATAEMSEQLPALPLHTCARTLLRRSTGHGTTGVSLHALRCADLLAMTSYEIMHEFCGRFSLRKQIQKYNRNTHHPKPSVFRSMAQIKTYPFAVLFAKEPLYFRQINPRSKAQSQVMFSSLEM